MKANIKYSNSDDLSIIITSFKLSPVNNIKHLSSYTYKYFVLHIVNCLVTIIIKSERSHSDVDGTPAIASPLLLRLFASESFPLRHDQILVGLRAPGVEVLVRVVAHAFVRNLDFFGLDASERLVLHLLGGTVGAVAVADRSAAVNFREFSFFPDFNFFVFVDIAVAATDVRRLGNFLPTVGLQLFRRRRLRSRFVEIDLLFVLTRKQRSSMLIYR